MYAICFFMTTVLYYFLADSFTLGLDLGMQCEHRGDIFLFRNLFLRVFYNFPVLFSRTAIPLVVSRLFFCQ